mmetsp:Transcript_37701/g.82818  ORF Transcript_37701/g.82818 Transcript_37701/m.82818 type:complete len:208 (+) Transcript_37701:2424-3047(+)
MPHSTHPHHRVGARRWRSSKVWQVNWPDLEVIRWVITSRVNQLTAGVVLLFVTVDRMRPPGQGDRLIYIFGTTHAAHEAVLSLDASPELLGLHVVPGLAFFPLEGSPLEVGRLVPLLRVPPRRPLVPCWFGHVPHRLDAALWNSPPRRCRHLKRSLGCALELLDRLLSLNFPLHVHGGQLVSARLPVVMPWEFGREILVTHALLRGG